MFPTVFSDLSYVRANVSKRDAEITDDEKELVRRYLKPDYAVFELAEKFLDQMLETAFHSADDRQAALHEFQDRCSRRYHNFYPPVAPGEPVPPVGTIPKFPPPTKPTEPTEPAEPTEHDPNFPEAKLDTVDSDEAVETKPPVEDVPEDPTSI